MLVAYEYNSKLKPGSSPGETLDIVLTHIQRKGISLDVVNGVLALGETSPGPATLRKVLDVTLLLAMELVDIRTALGAEPAGHSAAPAHGTDEPPRCCPAHAVEYVLDLLKKKAAAPSSGN